MASKKKPNNIELHYQRSLTPENLEQRAREQLEIQRRRNESMEIPAADLYDIYMHLKEKYLSQRQPVSLSTIWETLTQSKYLRDIGCTVSTEPHKKLTIRGVDRVAEGTPLTVDRSLYERGLADSYRPLHFATYGDDVFNELLHLFDEYELPACVMRLTERVAETHAELVGYAVASLEPDDRKSIRLVTSWDDLSGMVLDETAVLDENAVADAKAKLHDLIRKEFDPTRAVERLERDNRRAAHAQALLDLLIINQLLPPFDVSVAENFWSTVNHMDSLIQQRDELLVTKLPVPVLQQLKNATLFNVPTPRVGEVTSPTVPILLVSAGLDAACRAADALKVGRSNLTIETVKRRIQSEINQQFKEFSRQPN